MSIAFVLFLNKFILNMLYALYIYSLQIYAGGCFHSCFYVACSFSLKFESAFGNVRERASMD